MDETISFLMQHQLVIGAAGALVLSAAARALPEPVEMGSRFYLWFYRFSHYLLANWDKNKTAAK